MGPDYIVLDGLHYTVRNTGSTLCYCSANEGPRDVFYIMMCDHENTSDCCFLPLFQLQHIV